MSIRFKKGDMFAAGAQVDGLGAAKVAIPALGCGYGGLEWWEVKRMIEERLGDLQADIVVFEPR